MGNDREPAAASPTWNVAVRCLVSLAIIWHLGAVLVAPMSLPPSLIPSMLRQNVFHRYNEVAFLDHANKFFAPDPGPSHLVRYEVEMPDGSITKGTMPNLKEQWPRLLYHRYFMLTERIGNGPPDVDPSTLNPDWTRHTPTRWETALARSYADHLLDQYHARRVTLYLVQHRLYPQALVADGAQLDHANSYVERPLGTFVNQASL